MTQFADLVTRAWAHAKCPQADLYLAGHDCEGYALLSDEPTAYSESFIARCEELTGCTFARVPVDAYEALRLEYHHWLAAYASIEAKDLWSDTDREWWRTLSNRVAELKTALKEFDHAEG